MVDTRLADALEASQLRALLLEWNDHHDEAHAIVQDCSDPTGSLIHGILHRREPDYGNAEYWMRRVGKHPCYRSLSTVLRASEFDWTAAQELKTRLLPGDDWSPVGMIESCESAITLPSSHPLYGCLMRVQQAEFRCLAEFILSQG